MSYSAGDLREKITIERTASSQDKNGYYNDAWVKVCDTWANVQDISGKEYFNAAATMALNIVSFVIRWRDDVNTGMRIIHNGKPYDIEYINRLGYKRDFMSIKARLKEGESIV